MNRLSKYLMKLMEILGPVVYTLGSPDVYDELLDDGERHWKLGPHIGSDRKRYPGGIVFPTISAAKAYLSRHGEYKNYHVYVLRGSWTRDAYRADDHYCIRRNLPIIGKAWPVAD